MRQGDTDTNPHGTGLVGTCQYVERRPIVKQTARVPTPLRGYTRGERTNGLDAALGPAVLSDRRGC